MSPSIHNEGTCRVMPDLKSSLPPHRLAILLAVIALGLAGTALVVALLRPQGQVLDTDGDAFAARVEAYMLEHPEIIPRAIGVLQRREEAAATARRSEAVATYWDKIAHDDYSPVLGNPEAAVTFVEFYDYRCAYCRRSHPDVARLVAEQGDEVRFVFRQFPVIDDVGDTDGPSHMAARAAIAADRQGRFRAFHDAVMTAPGRLTPERIFRIAEEVGLDIDRLKRDMSDPGIGRYISDTLLLADAVGIGATPTYVVNGRVLVGARGYDALLAMIRAGKSATASAR